MSYWIIDNQEASFNSVYDKDFNALHFEPNDLVYRELSIEQHSLKVNYSDLFRIIDELFDEIDCACAGETMFDLLITFRCDKSLSDKEIPF